MSPKGKANSADVSILLEEVNKLRRELEALRGEKVVIHHDTEEMAEIENYSKLDINPSEYIEIVSLCPYTLNLSTRPKGGGRVFTFRKFGEKKRILYSELVEVMENHKEYTDFLQEGYYYINDSRVVRKHGLDEIYGRILNREKIEKIINGDKNESVKLFESATASQRAMICDIIIKKMLDGQEFDLNIVDKLTKISGINIVETVEQVRLYLKTNEENSK